MASSGSCRPSSTGPVNVAPDGVVPLVQILRRLGRKRVVVPHFLYGLSKRVVAGLEKLPFDTAFLRFSAGADNRRMKEELGFTPRRTSRETLESLIHVPKKRNR